MKLMEIKHLNNSSMSALTDSRKNSALAKLFGMFLPSRLNNLN
jgi:hypothetical protein